MSRIRAAFLICLIPLGISPGVAEEAGRPDWADVGPIFATYCLNCHSATGAAVGLRLDSYAAALAGSERGPVLVAGAPAASELIRRLRGDSAPRMPFLSRALPDEDIALIARWIESGLPEGKSP